MKLKFRIETKKIKQPRIVVLRLSNQDDKVIEKSLGSFNSKRSYDHIVKQLTTEELYEFENFVRVINFSKKNFNCDADKLDRFIIKTAPEFKNALLKLWEAANQYGLSFTPEYEMLLSLFNKAKTIEQQLAVFTNNQFTALKELGIDIVNTHPPKADLKEEQKLMVAAIKTADSLEELADLFNKIASQKYNKAQKFKPHHFEYFAKQINQDEKQPFPKWYYTIVIDVLCHAGIKPDSIIAPALVTKLWLRLNKQANLTLTLQAFNQQFPHLNNHQECANIINVAFINDDLLKMGGKTAVAPGAAIELWLNQWKKSNPESDQYKAITVFNSSFSYLKNNVFFINFIEQSFSSNSSLEITSQD